jgi:putative effector of murein hydrolase
LAISLVLGSLTSIISAFGITALMHGTRELAIAMGPKSATTPIAMAITEKLGGIPSVSAVVVITTGIIGAMVGRFVFNRIGVASVEVRGFALGVSAHGIGTARAFQISSTMGSYAGLGMGLNGIMTAVLTPILVPILLRVFYS